MVDNLKACLAGCLVFLVVYRILQSRRTSKSYPPGPFALPVIGTLHLHGLSVNPETLMLMAKPYNGVMTIYIFGKPCVVLSSLESFEEAMLGRNDFAFKGLEHKFSWLTVDPHHKGIFSRDLGDDLMRVRNTSMSILRSLGAGKGGMERAIQEEAGHLIDMMLKSADRAFDASSLVSSAVANVILRIMLNDRLAYDDEEFLELQAHISQYLKTIKNTTLVNALPASRRVEPIKTGFRNWVSSHEAIMKFVAPRVDNALEESDTDSHNFIAQFANRMYGTERDSNGSGSIDTEQLQHVVLEMLSGGFDTTATSIKWTLMCLANRQHIQQKLFDEIMQVVGTEEPVSMHHKDQLQYLQAVVWEVQRYRTLLPLMPRMSNPHAETRLFKHTLPKGTKVFLNIYGVHMDEDTWGDPRVFRPERFLDDKGQVVKSKHVIPFSMGKRSCTGEVLAKQELYFFTALIFQRLQILPGRDVRIDEEPMVGGTLCPKPFTIKAIERQ